MSNTVLPLNQQALFVHIPTSLLSASTPLVFASEIATCDCYDVVDIAIESPVDFTLNVEYYGLPYVPSVSPAAASDPINVLAVPVGDAPILGYTLILPAGVSYRERVVVELSESPEGGEVPLSISVIYRRAR